MPRIELTVDCPIYESFRVSQLAGMFDLTPAERSRETFAVEVPDLEEDWSIGVIVGPSGSGKSTIARHVYGDAIYSGAKWPENRAVIDCFGELGIKEITHALTSVGFSSPPSWVKPFCVLSNGEQFRCNLARALLRETPLVVFDEFTSVVDRTVAKIGSAAVSKAIRSGKIRRRFVAVTCHYDVVDWLEPDWVIDMASRALARGRLRRPGLKLRIQRVDSSAWRLFKRHHYLSANLNRSATCFLGMIDGSPAVFDAWIQFVGRLSGRRQAKRCHRVVTLPDFQGVGIARAMTSSNAALWAALGYRVFFSSSHPGAIRSLQASGDWRMTSPPKLHTKGSHSADRTRASSRLTASFEFAGQPLAPLLAKLCLGD